MDRAEACEILNFYRNRHYTEPLGTEERELSDAINEILPHYAALREQDTPNKNAVKTNADRIRAMTDEELAKCVFDFCCELPCEWCKPTMRTPEKCNGRCTTGVLAWLQQPVKEETK